MLVHLHVKNLALIDEAEVDFSRGLNILTGETGAGKSILLGSMQLILGAKPQKNMIRANEDSALVELVFETEEESVLKELRDLGVSPEDGQVLMSRKITEGRSISRINGESCTVSQMKAAASCLLDIHGQHEHQSLLRRDRQLEILDAYGKDEIAKKREEVQKAYREYKDVVKKIAGMNTDEEQRNREISFLEYEIREIEEAALVPGEDEELERRYRKLSNSRQIMEALQNAHKLTGYEDGAGDQTGQGLRELGRVLAYDEELSGLSSMLKDIDDLLNDFNRELSSYMDDLTFDEENFFETEKRLDLVNSLKAKYGQQIGKILLYLEERKQKLDELMDFEEILKKLKAEEKRTEAVLKERSEELSLLRKKNAKELEKEIIQGLRDLNFLDVRFRIRFDRKDAYTDKGTDDVEYEISTNPGEKEKPLGEIVSGGELSRIMLAIKAILADKDQIGTLIFDEIDTGISGRTAQKVSEKMARIGRHRQVLCITHLPQIAAMADTHFEIEKHGDESGTITQIHPLSPEESVKELARLLGGAEITDAVLQNAREMKELANRVKSGQIE